MGSPDPKSGTVLRAGMGVDLSIPARRRSEKLRLGAIKGSQEHCSAHPAKTEGPAPCSHLSPLPTLPDPGTRR